MRIDKRQRRYGKQFHELLTDLYVNRRFAVLKIAEVTGATRKTVDRHLQIMGVTKRPWNINKHLAERYKNSSQDERKKYTAKANQIWREKLKNDPGTIEWMRKHNERVQPLITRRAKEKAGPSGLESLVHSALRDAGVSFIPEHPVCEKFSCDLGFPGINKVVELHGCYWHGHFCKGLKSSHRLELQRKKDRKKIREIKKQGYKLMILWECRIKKNLPASVEKIKRFIAQE